MTRIVTQNKRKPNTWDLEISLQKWESCKPPYSSSHMQICVTASKVILKHLGQTRRSKYERASHLRMDFNKSGKCTIYAQFPKKTGLKGRKLGEWPELQLNVARDMASEMAKDGFKSESVHQALTMYQDDLWAKVERSKLSENSFYTYCCRIKALRASFGEREVFADVSYDRLIAVLDEWVQSKSNNQAIELFAELKRFYKFASPKIFSGRNVASSLPEDYISSRVQKPMPTRLYTDIRSIAQLWLNVAACTSLHQKNAIRYMILTGVRPINVCNLKWEWVFDDEIVYPGGVTGMRGAMKTQKEFRLPITPAIKRILDEQREWIDATLPACNAEFVFLQPRKPMEAFAKRSLDKIIKTYSPKDAVKGQRHEGTVKGSAGAFNTMCRKFLKSNIIIQMRAKGYSRSDTREVSLLCLHHSDRSVDPMAEHYDFSDEIMHEEMALKRIAFGAHEDSILAEVALCRKI